MLTEITAAALAGTLAQPARETLEEIGARVDAAPAAPAAPVFTFPGTPTASTEPTTPEDEYLREHIKRDDLIKLAARLERRNDEHSKECGRRLNRALRGELHAGLHAGDDGAFKMAGDILDGYPNADVESILPFFAASFSHRENQGGGTTLETFREKFVRIQDTRRAALNTREHTKAKLGKTAAEFLMGSAAGPAPAAAQAFVQEPTAWQTLFVLADGVTYLRRPEETVYRWALKGDRAISVELARQFGADNVIVPTHNKGEAVPLAELMPLYASNAHTIVHDYSSESTTFDAAAATLHVGLPAELPEPRLDVDVHNWLTVFVGSTEADESAISDLYDWVASCTREHITKAAVALVMNGDTGIGKSRFAEGMAGTWGLRTVDIQNAVQQFNGALLHSPFLFADEQLPPELTDTRFRKLIQEDSRLVEPKGREKVTLLGYSRMLLAVNGEDVLQGLGGISNASATNATAARIAYFDCTVNAPEVVRAALEPLKLAGSAQLDMKRIVGHLRWVQTRWAEENGAPRPQPYLGARRESAAATALLHGSMRKTCPALFELLDRYAADPSAFEARYHAVADTVTGNVLGLEYPLVTYKGKPWARFSELAKLVVAGAPGTRASDVERALEALRPASAAEREPQVVHPVPSRHEAKWKYRQLDEKQLAGAIGVSLENVLSKSTSERSRQNLADAAAKVAPGFAELSQKQASFVSGKTGV